VNMMLLVLQLNVDTDFTNRTCFPRRNNVIVKNSEQLSLWITYQNSFCLLGHEFQITIVDRIGKHQLKPMTMLSVKA
jgi:hypothetical protein